MKSGKSHSEPLDLEGSIPFTDEDRKALWKARIESRKMTDEQYVKFLESFPPRPPDRTIRGIPGDELDL